MLVSEAITLLRSGELKQVSVKDDDAAVIGYLNMAVLEIHKRFPLWQEEALITMIDGVTQYKLDGIDTNVGIDLSDHEVLMIDEVYAPSGKEIVLNNERDPLSIFTPRPHVLEVKVPFTDGDTSVIYRASPKFMTATSDVIQLPPQFTEALFNYVGYRGHGSVKGDIKSENNTHYMRFEKSCDQVLADGLVAPDDLESTKFDDRGYV